MEYRQVYDYVVGLSFKERHRLLVGIVERHYECDNRNATMWCDMCKLNTTHQLQYTVNGQRLTVTHVCRDCKIIRGANNHSPDYGVFGLTSEERHHLLLRILDMYDNVGCFTFGRCEVCDRKTSGYYAIYSSCQRIGCETQICHGCRTDCDRPLTAFYLYGSYTCTHHKNPTLRSMAFRCITSTTSYKNLQRLESCDDEVVA